MKAPEASLISDYFEDQLERFESEPETIKPTLAVGEYPLQDEDINSKTAALMQVIVSLYNLEETITKI
jgi:hypothetical protein